MDQHTHSGSFHDTLLVALRQRRVIVGTYLAILATAVAALFILPPSYRASSKILVTSNRADISTNPERPTELVRTNQVSPADLNSQLEILRSRELIDGVLRDMSVTGTEAGGIRGIVRTVLGAPVGFVRFAYQHLHHLDSVGTASTFDARVTAALEATEAVALRNSNVIEVAVTEKDPVSARDFVNRLASAYLDRQARMQRESEAERFFTEQSEVLRRKLAESEAALRAGRERVGTLAGQQAEVHERLNEFNAESARTKIARREQEGRVAFLERTLGTAGRVATPELLQLEAKRADLLGRYRPDSERVREVDAQIKTLRGAIAGYQTVTAPGAVANETDITAARAALAALTGKEEALTTQREEYRSQAELLDAASVELARLERQVKLDDEAYVSYVRTAEEARLSNALQQSNMLRLSIVEPATLASETVSPNAARILAFALIGGLAVSVGFGFARDRVDPTLKSAADVRRLGEFEVLAVLPERA